MNIKHLLLLIAACYCIRFATAATVDEQTARTVAGNFLQAQTNHAVNPLRLVLKKSDAGVPLYYVFNHGDQGFVIVAGDDRVAPILGYSVEKPFVVHANPADTCRGNNFWGWMKNYEMQIDQVIRQNIPATAEVAARWQKLLSGTWTPDQSATIVNPLLTTTWDQGWPYNAYCPLDPSGPNGHVWTGCVATAMSQIMRFWSLPQHGIGSHCYTYGGYPQTCANFNTNYNWANMPNSVSTLNPDVATINYHAAVSVNSQWGGSSTGVTYSSSAPPMQLAFWNNFLFAYDGLKYLEKGNYTVAQWDSIVQHDLLLGMPTYYRGDGNISHAWVCDGVNASNMYHFNFGWGGSYNGWYLLTAITPGSNNLTNNQHCIVGIKPNTDGSTITTNTTLSGTVVKTTSIGVPDSLTLTLSPGTTLKMAGGKEIRVMGKLISAGDSLHPILITANDTNQRFVGPQWNNALGRMHPSYLSKLVWTQIQYSKQHGIYCDNYGSVLVRHCKLNNNDAGVWNGTTGQTNGYGGAVFARGVALSIDSCEIYNNHAAIEGGGIYMVNTGSSSANINMNNIHNNVADVSGGGMGLTGVWDVVVSNNNIHHNHASSGAGGQISGGSPRIINSSVVNNTTISSSGKGGAFYFDLGASGMVVGCLITGNGAYSAGSIGLWNGSSTLFINNTITSNTTQATSNIVLTYGSVPIFKNTIIYGNSNGNGKEMYLGNAACIPTINHCDFQGGINALGGPGASTYPSTSFTFNKDTIPGFVNSGSGDYHLVGNSTLNNYGDTTGVSQYIPLQDLDGKPRYTGIIDLGPYEYCQGPGSATIAGNQNPCTGTTQTYTATSTGANYYTWTVPTGNGWNLIAGQGSASISVMVGATNGSISVVPSNTCSSGSSGSLNIAVSQIPANAAAITGPNNVCKGTGGIVYTVPVISNATGYAWTLPTGFTITNGNNTNSITVSVGTNAVSGNISVYGTNTCGNGQSSPSLAVTVNFVTANAGADQTIPNGTSTTLTGSAASGSGNYTWSWQPAALLVNPGIQNPQTVNLASSALFTLSVTDATTGCTAGDDVLITVTGGVLSVDATASPNPVCAAGMVQLMAITGGGSGNYTFAWSSTPAGFTSALANPVAYPLITTTYKVVVNDGFSTVGDSIVVTVNPLAGVPSMPVGPDTVNLKTVATSEYKTNKTTAATSYSWELTPSAAGIITGTDTLATVTWNSGFLGQAHIRVKAANSCGESAWSPEKVTFVDNTTGVTTNQPLAFIIYPNPTDGQFTLALSGGGSSKVKVSVYGLQGIKIMEAVMDGDAGRKFSLSGCPAGVYCVIMENGRAVRMAKVVKF